jgi:hypothetical protein
MTDAMIAASRANGAKSTGPTADAGRAKVKFNAVQHGAACEKIVFLPGEDPEAFWAKVDRIAREQKAEGELEIEAIKTAVYSGVTQAAGDQRKCDRRDRDHGQDRGPL